MSCSQNGVAGREARPVNAAVAAPATAGVAWLWSWLFACALAAPALASTSGDGPTADHAVTAGEASIPAAPPAANAADEAIAPLPSWHLLVGDGPSGVGAGGGKEEPGPDVVPLPPALVGAGAVLAVLLVKRRLAPRRA